MKILFVQELLPSYRKKIFNELAVEEEVQLSVLTGDTHKDYGILSEKVFFDLTVSEWHSFFRHFKYNKKFFKSFKENEVIVHVADFKFITLWVSLIFTKFSKKKLYLHGQGGYKKQGFFQSFLYTLACGMADGYICYTEFSKNELLKRIPHILHHKAFVCENTLSVRSVKAISEKNLNYIFYIGRIRQGCGIELLLEAARKSELKIKIIGSGSKKYVEQLKENFEDVAIFYGGVFDEELQQQIAEGCLCGAYGGDAGLSVVHYFALGLPVIVHNDIGKHMGPEPSYVVDNMNGLTFKRDSLQDLVSKLLKLKNNSEFRNALANEALNRFKELNQISMAKKFLNIIKSNP